jgi:RNA 3'-terminal phosphate cyclase (ATP)
MLEGGGQLLRNASALAAITCTPIMVDSIRAGRSNPGLRPQHLTGLALVERLSRGSLLGGALNSTAVVLQPGPGPLQCGDSVADTRTAGSCLLLAQTALPCLLLAAPPPGAAPGAGGASRLELRGGTDASMAPPVGYLEHVLLPSLRRLLGVRVSMDLRRRGFYPKGGGVVTLEAVSLPPGALLPPVVLTERGAVTAIRIHAFTAGRVGEGVGRRMAAAAEAALRAGGVGPGVPIECAVVHEPPERAVGDGCGVVAVAETAAGRLLGASGLGERWVAAEEVGRRAGEELAGALRGGACVDDWLQDQLIIFMALAGGESKVVAGEPTLHTRTAVAVAEALTAARFTLAARGDGTWLIGCTGAGLPAGGARV